VLTGRDFHCGDESGPAANSLKGGCQSPFPL